MSKVYIAELNIEVIICNGCHKLILWDEGFYTITKRPHFIDLSNYTLDAKISDIVQAVTEKHYHNQCGLNELDRLNEQYTQ